MSRNSANLPAIYDNGRSNCWSISLSLRQACAYWGLPPWLNEWCQAAIKLDTKLRKCHPKEDLRQLTINQLGLPVVSSPPERHTHLTIQCFRRGQPGHLVVECPAPTLREKLGFPGPEKARKTPKVVHPRWCTKQ
ncbi:hypothetical protein E2320_002732 [Naja naja]|nr:hypothetical protein E2320_002732 [Naja naja]